MDTFENDLESKIKQYVLKQLDDSEVEAFEEYFLANPEIIDRIQTVQKLNAGLNEIEQAAYVIGKPANEVGVAQRLLDWLQFPIPAFAAIAVALLGPTLMVINQAEVSKPYQQYHLADISQGLSRDAHRVIGVDLTSQDDPTAVLVRVEKVSYPNYQLVVKDAENGETVWESELFSFASGVRDRLLVLPSKAAIPSANISLLGIDSDNSRSAVKFCNYTESCR